MTALRLLLAAIVIYLPNQQLFRIEFTIKGLNVINVLFLLALTLMLMVKPKSGTSAPLKGPFYFFFAMLVWGYLVGVMHDPSEWVNDLTVLKNSIFYMLLFFLFYHAANDMKTVRFVFAVVLFVTFVASVQGLRQALDYGIAVYNETRRVSAPFGWSYTNANRAAVFFVIFLPMFAAVALFYKSKPMYRLVAAGCLALGAFVVFFTYSRQAYFILALLALLLAVRRSVFLASLIMVALLTFESWAPETAVERLQSTTQSEDGGGHAAPRAGAEPAAGEGAYDESTESRFIIWEGAAQLIAERPWGIGLNHFKREIGAYVPTYRNMDAHNFYVLITTEAGLLGPVATLTLIFGLWRLGRRVEKVDASDESKLLGVGFTMSVIAVALGNVYGSRFLDGDVMGNFWILAGIVARYHALAKQASAAPQAAAPAGDRNRPAAGRNRSPLEQAGAK
jgi:O-antigen ligase